jgi:hypothetical protein
LFGGSETTQHDKLDVFADATVDELQRETAVSESRIVLSGREPSACASGQRECLGSRGAGLAVLDCGPRPARGVVMAPKVGVDPARASAGHATARGTDTRRPG